METLRGFVLRIEVGRAGLVRVTILLDDGNVRIFVINDLDADPERFNERLSKLAILRDAMDRAEPVEIESAGGEAGETIERVARITRDDMAAIPRVAEIIGFVLNIVIHAENRTGAQAESGDHSSIRVLTSDMTSHQLILPLQIPERQVAVEQLELVRDAQAQGYPVRFLVVDSTGDDVGISGINRIIAVEMLEDANIFDEDAATLVHGFVESISLMRVIGGDQHNFAHIRFTTSPPLSGAGGTVPLVPFTPQILNLLVPQNSPSYALFEAGLRDNLLMRTQVVSPVGRDKPNDPDEPRDPDQPSTPAAGTPSQPGGAVGTSFEGRRIAAARDVSVERATYTPADQSQNFLLSFAAELNAHLASASRPVWLMISRDSLDVGPRDEANCATGTPTSDLRVSTLRDLRIPYDAVWYGLACANPGIYRFQIEVPTDVILYVDDREVCIHPAVDGNAQFGHACLDGQHEIKVVIRDWICDYDFILDVYQLR